MAGEEPWDSALNMVNWYAIDRYCEDPDAHPEAIARDWATETFGRQAAPVVTEIVSKASTATANICHFRGGWLNCHSYMADLLYLDSRLCGPYRNTDRIAGMIGMDNPTDMYVPERAAEIAADASVALCFGKLPITPELQAELLKQEQQAVELFNESISLWQSLKDKVEPEIHDSVLALLEGRRNDAIFCQAQMTMYMDYKLGQLTEQRVDELLEECRGLQGMWIKDPMATEKPSLSVYPMFATPATFANQLREELRNPQLEQLWASLPKYEGIGYGCKPGGW